MNALVLDASITLGWCFADEHSPIADKVLEKLKISQAIVPSLWPLEVSNILVNSIRKKRISYAEALEFITLLQNLPIEIDNHTARKGFQETLQLSYAEGITAYDAAYLELAMRFSLPLATQDKLLAKVANKIGVVLL